MIVELFSYFYLFLKLTAIEGHFTLFKIPQPPKHGIHLLITKDCWGFLNSAKTLTLLDIEEMFERLAIFRIFISW
jgi:hypothetical protein